MRASVEALTEFDEVVVATGVRPRMPAIPGIDHPSVMSYAACVAEGRPVGRRVAVIGASGIGVDVAEFLVNATSPTLDLPQWQHEWGVTDPALAPGGLTRPEVEPPAREVYLFQRKGSGIGKGLGKTTRWVHRAALKAKGVQQLTGVNYERIDDDGLHITFGQERSGARVLDVDTVVVCAGQEPVNSLGEALRTAGVRTHVIGGADVAAELDAKRAIRQGTEVAAAI